MSLAGLLLAPAGGCAARQEPARQESKRQEPAARQGPVVLDPDLETTLVLKNAAGEETRTFRSGEPVTLVVTIRNRAGSSRTLTLPTSQTHDCLISRAGSAPRAEVWRASAGQMFAQVLSELTLGPGESRPFTTTWNQTDTRGKPVPPGEYQAVGLVPGGAPGCRSEAARFTIRSGTAGPG